MIAANPRFREKRWYDYFWDTNPQAFGAPNSQMVELIQLIHQSLRGQTTGRPRAIDIAAGNGRYTLALESIGFSVVAVDISETACRLLSEAIPEDAKDSILIECNDYLSRDSSITPEHWDLVFSSGLLEELTEEQQRKAIDKMKRSVLPGGYILLKYCLEIDNRGQQVQNGFVESNFDITWEVIRKIEHTEMKEYPQGISGEGRIRTGLFCAKKTS